jgi:hypothetical protein
MYIQSNHTMSTQSESHRLMQEIKADDLDILADIAYQQEQAMREEEEEQEFLGLVTSFMMTEEITYAEAEKKAHDLMDASSPAPSTPSSLQN